VTRLGIEPTFYLGHTKNSNNDDDDDDDDDDGDY